MVKHRGMERSQEHRQPAQALSYSREDGVRDLDEIQVPALGPQYQASSPSSAFLHKNGILAP